jgi:phosphoglycolate phosphatase
MRQFEHYLFDFDGTLFDSSQGILNAITYAVGEMGLKPLPQKHLNRFIGPPLSLSFGKYCGLDKAGSQEAIRHLRVYYKEYGVLQADPYPGIRIMIEELLHAKKKLYIATSKPTRFAEQILDRYGIRDAFVMIQGSGLVGDIMEKTEIMHAICKKKPALRRGNAIMVGDTIHDVHGAHNVGMPSIAVLYGFGTTQDLLAARPTQIADSVSTLREIIT